MAKKKTKPSTRKKQKSKARKTAARTAKKSVSRRAKKSMRVPKTRGKKAGKKKGSPSKSKKLRSARKPSQMKWAMPPIIGTVIHWYDHIMVAVVRLQKPLAVGDTVTIQRNETSFTHTIDSMQFDHVPITRGSKGQEVAIKLPAITKEGAVVLPA